MNTCEEKLIDISKQRDNFFNESLSLKSQIEDLKKSIYELDLKMLNSKKQKEDLVLTLNIYKEMYVNILEKLMDKI